MISCAPDEYEVYGSIGGVVLDAAKATPLPGVKVTITPGGTSQITSTEGTYTFEELTPQEYTINFTKEGYESTTHKTSVKAGVASNVQAVMSEIKPQLAVSPPELDFGSEQATLAMDITNTGKGTLTWTIKEDIAWLSCSEAKGSTTDKVSAVTVTVNREGLNAGEYSGSIVVSSNGGSKTVKVRMEVSDEGLVVEPKELDFGTLTNTIQLTLTNTTGTTTEYTVTSSNNWLVPGKKSGSISKTDYINVLVSREGLSEGDYNGSLAFHIPGAEVVVPVKMSVATNTRPTVTLESVDGVSYNSALLHGMIVSPGSAEVSRYGVCYAEKPNPTIDDMVTNMGNTKSPVRFESRITNLKMDTRYYVRAYAINSVGVAYSTHEIDFFTSKEPTVPVVRTEDVTSVTGATAMASGVVESLGNVSKLSAYGHVWAQRPDPTLGNGKYSQLGEKSETGAFTSSLDGLQPNTSYYVRAYATNEVGTAYGESKVFTTAKRDVALSTNEVTEITYNSAVCGGVITAENGHTIMERGVCWSAASMPTVSDNTATASSGSSYTCALSGLTEQTTYYVRAYVRTSENIVCYGNERQFATLKVVALPVVSSVTVSGVASATATVESYVQSEEPVTECGFVYSLSQSPTVTNGTKVECPAYTGSIKQTLTGLSQGTRYYVRAYARNAGGVSYSEQAMFTTLTQKSPIFSVSSGKQVCFSMGNLQYQPSTGKWRFAEHQYDCIGTANVPLLNNGNWYDLFGWGTGDNPTKRGGTYTDYNTFNDWGNNRIGNDAPRTWRTLSQEEWRYLIFYRTNAESLYAYATVNGVRGAMLMPDGWTLPAGVQFMSRKDGNYSYSQNDYSLSEWKILEASGAIFLPFAGRYKGSTADNTYTYDVNSRGCYCTSTPYNSIEAYGFHISTNNTFQIASSSRVEGASVRLVKDM